MQIKNYQGEPFTQQSRTGQKIRNIPYHILQPGFELELSLLTRGGTIMHSKYNRGEKKEITCVQTRKRIERNG